MVIEKSKMLPMFFNPVGKEQARMIRSNTTSILFSA